MARNTWSMRLASGDAVRGFIAFLEGKDFLNDNPYKDTVNYKEIIKYKNWASGWRDGKDATPEQINTFNWIYSRN